MTNSYGNIYCPYTITLNSEEYELYDNKRKELEESEEYYNDSELAEELLKYIRKLYGSRVEEEDQDLSEIYPGETEETTIYEEDLDK